MTDFDIQQLKAHVSEWEELVAMYARVIEYTIKHPLTSGRGSLATGIQIGSDTERNI